MIFQRSIGCLAAGALVGAAVLGCSGGPEGEVKKLASATGATGTVSEKPATASGNASSKVDSEPRDEKTEGPALSAEKSELPNLPRGAGAIDPDAPTEFTETESGLRYRILRKSEGRKPQPGERVVAHYKGWLDNGKQFDSSYDRDEPLAFAVKSGPGGVIAGWVEGVQLIGVGGMIELAIPGDLGYGPRGFPGTIPPNATLHFIVELQEIK